MIKTALKLAGCAAVSVALLPFSAWAQDKTSASASGSSAKTAATPASSDLPVEGWDDFVEALRILPQKMLAKMPESMRQDPQIRAEVGRVALEALASSTVDVLGSDPMAPAFVPTIGQVLNVGQPNADTIYKAASIDASQTYRLQGKLGDVTLFMLAQVIPGSNDRPHLDLSTLKADAQGRFSVVVGPTRPSGYDGDFWPLIPQTRRLMLRIVSSDWSHEEQPSITIERISGSPRRMRTSAAELSARLKALPRSVEMLATMFMSTVEELAQEGYVNRFKVMVPNQGALASQFYYDGVFDIAEDEALIVESDVPQSCRYRSLILTNTLYETLDWVNNHASLNQAQAQTDSDGRLRIVVSAKDPGVKNWLDTAGHLRGVIQGRWTGCDTQPIPTLTKVKLADLAKALPKDVTRVTPQEREAIVRERKRAYQERALW